MYKPKPHIDKHSLLSLYHSYIHSYINCGNIAWRSTTRTNLKKIYIKQKHAIRIVYSKDRLSHTRELFKQCKVLNVYQVNIWKNLVFMHQINSNTVPTIFFEQICPLTSPLTITQKTSMKLVTAYHLLSEINLNTVFQSEAQPCGKIFQLIQKKSNKKAISLKR